MIDPCLDRQQALDGQYRLRVDRQGVGDSADHDILDMRRLATENADHLVGMPLHLECLQIVDDSDQIDLGRELHRRVSPVAVGEDTELTGTNESCQPILDLGKLGLAVARPGRQALGEARCLARVGFQGAGDINPVERREVVEVHDMVVNGMRQNDHVPDVLGVDRHFELQRVLDGAYRSERMDCSTYAADALGDRPGITWIAPDQDVLDASPHLARGPRFLDLAAVHFDIDTQVAFDSGYWINRDSLRHFLVSW